jgi:hypothetical protein
MLMHLLTEELSVQVSWITISMFLCVDHVQRHATPPHSSLPEKVLAPSTRQPTKQPKQQELLRICPWRKLEPANQLHLRTTSGSQSCQSNKLCKRVKDYKLTQSWLYRLLIKSWRIAEDTEKAGGSGAVRIWQLYCCMLRFLAGLATIPEASIWNRFWIVLVNISQYWFKSIRYRF